MSNVASPRLLALLHAKAAPDPEIEAGYLSGAIATRLASTGPLNRAARRRFGALFARRRCQRSPDREKSIRRRRQLAASGPLPPTLAAFLTTAEQAVARIVRDDFMVKGRCDAPIDAIAARAGVCSKTVQRALRRLGAGKVSVREPIEGLNWIEVQLRPVRGRKHLPNIVRVVSPEWLAWIARGPLPRTGGQLRPTTDNVINSSVEEAAAPGRRNGDPVPGLSVAGAVASAPAQGFAERRAFAKRTRSLGHAISDLSACIASNEPGFAKGELGSPLDGEPQ